ncbi:sal-like protein 3 [Gigantopelta aegis]|uniref:sal-like protein 3 n=1 Tax=Gigantopelta aegis TaxID=1735272 RepID=UPI001B88A2A5|nr:sal-like protein 3 [Gigantopelta aegis]
MSRRKQIKPQHISNGSDEDDDNDRKLQIDIKDNVTSSKTVERHTETEEPTTKTDETEEKECDSSDESTEKSQLTKSCCNSKHKKISKSDSERNNKELNKSDTEAENKELIKSDTEEEHKDHKKSVRTESDCNNVESRKSSKVTGVAETGSPSLKKAARNVGISPSSGNVIVTRTVARLRQQGKRDGTVKNDDDDHDRKRKYDSDSDADESDQDDVAESWTPEKPAAGGKTLRSAGRRPMTTDSSPRLHGRTCEYCGAVKPTPAALQRHLRKHTGERPFVCKVCSKAYKAKRSLQLHLLSNHSAMIDKSAPHHIKQDTTNQLREAIEQKMKNEKSLEHPTPSKSPSGDPTEHSTSNETPTVDERGGLLGVDAVSGSVDRRPEEASPGALDELTANHAMSRTCKYCGKICLKPSDLKRHVLLHTGDKPYTCEVCGKSFKAKGSMLYHQKAAHNMNVELSQSLAERYMKLKNRSFEKSLYVHERIAEYHHHIFNGSLKNDLDEPALSAEKQNHELESIADGDSAGEKSKGNNSRCVDGVVSFLSAGEHHSEKNNVPSFLESSSAFPSAVNRQFSSTSDGSAEALINNSQEDVGDAVGTVVTGDGPFMKSRIRIRNETVLITRLDGVNLSTNKETSMYKCYICGAMLSSLSNVQVHLSMHFDLEITTYQCRHCDATFESKHQMLQHVLSHKINNKLESREKTDEEVTVSDERLLVEDGEDFGESVVTGKKQKADINENTDLAADLCMEKSGVRLVGSWECKYCRKSFSRLYLLQRHERIHNGQRMFYCKECRKGFSESVNLHQHMVRFHDISKTMYSQVDSVLPRKMDKANLESLMRIAYWDRLSDHTSPDGNAANNSEEVTTSPEGQQHLKDLEKAKEFLEKEGLQENITVVMPSEPPTEQDRANSDTQHSGSNHMSDSDPEDPEIKAAPKRSLMSFRKEGPPSKSRRKASLPVKLDSVKSPAEKHVEPAAVTTTLTTSSSEPTAPSADADDIIRAEEIKQEAVGEEEVEVGVGVDGDQADVAVTLPTCLASSSVLNTVLSNSAVLASLNPLILASTVAAAAAAAAAQSQSSQLLAGSGLAAGLPATGYSSSSCVSSMPISVQVSEPSQPSVRRSVSPTHSSSSQPSPADPDSLVGFPRVQWNPSPTDSSSGPSPPDGRKLHHSWQHVTSDSISSDGRKVTSLSRTHSRLHVVNQPIDRDMVCKPVVLPDGRAVFRCVFCSKDFLSFSDINRHMDFHEDIRPYKCKYCDYYARTNSQLKVHMMRHQGIRDFCCKLCNYKGVTQSDLNRHMKSQIHLLKSQNECKHCREGFVTARNLEKHLDGNCIVKVHDLDMTD